MNVALILDLRADERALAGAQAYWLIASPENRSLAARLAETADYDVNSAVFDGDRYASRADAALGVLDNIDEHHPDWTEVAVAGVQLSEGLVAALSASGRRGMSTEDGFVVTRT